MLGDALAVASNNWCQLYQRGQLGWVNTDQLPDPRPYRFYNCLLYTSDAADERSSVDLGGRRFIKKKTNTTNKQTASHTPHDTFMPTVIIYAPKSTQPH